MLLVPLLVATGYSKDGFSSDYVAKWGKIERQMMQKRIADARATQPKLPPRRLPSPIPTPARGSRRRREWPGVLPPIRDNRTTPPEPKKDEAAAEAWGAFTMEDLKKMVPQNDKGEFLLDVPQIFYTAGDKELMDVMEGIPVETTAQLMEETLNNPDKTRLKAFRLFIECCAADARPLSIGRFRQGAPGIHRDGLVQALREAPLLKGERGNHPGDPDRADRSHRRADRRSSFLIGDSPGACCAIRK